MIPMARCCCAAASTRPLAQAANHALRPADASRDARAAWSPPDTGVAMGGTRTTDDDQPKHGSTLLPIAQRDRSTGAQGAAPLLWNLHFHRFSDGKTLPEDFINSTLDAIDAGFRPSRRPSLSPSTSEPDLIIALQFPDPDIRRKAAGLLGDAGTGSRGAVIALTAMAERSQDIARVDAIEALGRIGPDAASAVPALIKLLAVSGTIRQATVRALNEIAPQDPRVLSAIDSAGVPPPTTQAGGH